MKHSSESDITQILIGFGLSGGDSGDAADRLYDAVYGELRKTAVALMRKERVNHTLQATALVHEAYIRLVDQSRVQWQNRAHFYGIAARAMRQILIDHARKHGARKRGGDLRRITLDENIGESYRSPLDVIDLHEALDRLAVKDERVARVVELRIFGGMPSREVAHMLGVSKRTVDSDWKFATIWLARELSDERST